MQRAASFQREGSRQLAAAQARLAIASVLRFAQDPGAAPTRGAPSFVALFVDQVPDFLLAEQGVLSSDILPRMSSGKPGCLRSILGLIVLCVAIVYGVAALTSPWSFHIGGRWTPLLYWSGSGKLVTPKGTYPLYVSFFPGSHFSRLHLDGLRPTGGLQGSGWICTAPGTTERLNLGGTIYGNWTTTDGSLMTFRLLERRVFDLGQRQGYFDLYGRWRGQQLVMDSRDRVGGVFQSGMKIDHASVTFDWGSYSNFKSMCARATNFTKQP